MGPSSSWLASSSCGPLLGELVPLAPVEQAAKRFRILSGPLLQEKRHAGLLALVAKRADPPGIDWTPALAAFSADDHPIDHPQGVVFVDRIAASEARVVI